jgi:outer membrane protein assembly factor BamB
VLNTPSVGNDGTIYLLLAADQPIYYADVTVLLIALEPTKGQLIGSFALTNETVPPPVSTQAIGHDDKTVYFAVNQSLYSLSRVENGTLNWSTNLNAYLNSSPAVTNGTLYIGDGNANVLALNSTNGELLWKFQTADGIVVSPAIGTDGTMYIGGYRTMYAFWMHGPPCQ